MGGNFKLLYETKVHLSFRITLPAGSVSFKI